MRGLPCLRRCSACTTRSIFMNRDPLTSTAAAAGAVGSAAAARQQRCLEVAKCRPVRPGVRTARRPSRPCSMPARAAWRTHFGVELRALCAHLAHVAQQQPARAGHGGQHVDGGQHRVGVGVVAVVDQRDAPAAAAVQLRQRAASGRPPARSPPGPAPRRPAARRPPSAQAAAATALRSVVAAGLAHRGGDVGPAACAGSAPRPAPCPATAATSAVTCRPRPCVQRKGPCTRRVPARRATARRRRRRPGTRPCRRPAARR
jgi:hypothetical protein